MEAGSSRAGCLAAVLLFTVLGIGVLGPLLRPGYLLLLDSPAGPEPLAPVFAPLPSRGLIASSAPFVALLRAVNSLSPELGNKALVFLTVLLGGLGLYRFATRKLALAAPAGLVAGTLFVVNPWVYDRLLAGQLWLTLAYGLLPWALPALGELASSGHTSTALRGALWAGGIAVVDLHIGGMVLLLLVIAALASPGSVSRRLGLGLLGSLGIVALHLYWVLPAILAQEAGRLGGADLGAFAPEPRSPHILTHVLLLHGFWRHEFPTPLSSLRAEFLAAFLPLAVCALYGLALAVDNGRWRRAATALAVTCALAVVLGMGTSFPPTAPLARFLFRTVPGYGIFREPQKWIGLLALGYSVFAAVGINAVCARVAGRWGAGLARAAAVVAILPLVATPLMLWGFAGQVTPSHFPSDWYRAARALEGQQGRLLFLPWNQYQPLPFADDRVIANPADLFFPIPTLVSPEARTGGTVSADPRLRYVTKLLRRPADIDLFGHLVAPLGVRYVALARIADFARFGWLDEQPDLRLVFRGDDLTLYENDAWRGDLYGLRPQRIGGDELPEAGPPTLRQQRLAPARLIPAPPVTESGRLPGFGFARAFAVQRLRPRAGPLLGTSLACSDGWRLDEARPACQLGAVAAFPQPQRQATLWRPGLATQLASYAFSAIALGVLLSALRRVARSERRWPSRRSLQRP